MSEALNVELSVANALLKRDFVLRAFGESSAIIDLYDEALARFAGDHNSDARLGVTLTSMDKALLCTEIGNETAAVEACRSAYLLLAPEDETLIGLLTRTYIPSFIASGISERELLEILSSDPDMAAALEPLIVALRLRLGEEPRAPEIVLEVARDVNEHIDKVVAETRAGAA